MSYTYDDRSNRASLTSAGSNPYVMTYAYDKNNRLLSRTKKVSGTTTETATYTYNNIGSLTGKTIKNGSNVVQSSTSYTYNPRGELVGTVTTGTNAGTAAFTYQPDGLRMAKTIDGTVTKFVWDRDKMTLELTDTDAIVAKYDYGEELVYRGNESGTRRYFLHNGHGDGNAFTNGSGASVRTYDYDAFGVQQNIVSSDVNPIRYADEYYEKTTGLYYLRGRYYDPSIGRFITEDPAKDGTNWYVYCGNNPVMFVDPSGYIRESNEVKSIFVQICILNYTESYM